MKQTAEKQGFISKIVSKILSIPYSVMDKYVKSQNNTSDFQTMYSNTWFIALTAMFVLIGICFWVDFQVLYGIEFNSTMDANHSWWSAFKSSVIIQFLIIVCGGLFFKILIFGKLKSDKKQDFYFFSAPIDKKHLIQCTIFGVLFLYGFAWTLDLAYKTYNSAKANALTNKINLDAKYKTGLDDLEKERIYKSTDLQNNANKNILAIEINYDAQLKNIQAKYEARKQKKLADFENKTIGKAKLTAALAEYETAMQKEQSPLLKAKADKINPIYEALNKELENIKVHYQTLEKNLDFQANSAKLELHDEIESTALETRGRNVKYNLISVILMIGLLFFTKGCLEDAANGKNSNAQKNNSNPNNTTHTDDDNTDFDNDDEPDDVGHHSTQSSAGSSKNTGKSTVNTNKNTDTNNPDDYLEFEETETQKETQEESFSRDGYDFKKKHGKIYIKHGSTFADIHTLNVWYKTYNDRVQDYLKKGKADMVKKNATMAAIISQKINYLKDNFVHGFTRKTSSHT